MALMKSDIDKEFEKIEQLQKRKYPLLCGCVKDGILYPELYEKSPLKLMFVLSEPLEKGTGNIQSPLNVDLNMGDAGYKLEPHHQKELNRIWIKIAAMAYALRNRCIYSEKLSWPQVNEGLSCVSLIHLSKTPWGTKSDAENSFYLERVYDWEPVIKKQLLSIGFDIILFGQTWDCSSINPIKPNEIWDYRKMTDVRMYIQNTSNNEKRGLQIFRYDNSRQIIVNGYHPSDGNSACWQTECIINYLDSNNKEL